MHISVPRAVGTNPSSYAFITYDKGKGEEARYRSLFWLSKDGDLDDLISTDPYFREKRRKNFSDVCHSKWMLFDQLPGSGAWSATDPNFPDVINSPKYRYFGYCSDSFSWERSSSNYGPGGGYLTCYGNGKKFISFKSSVNSSSSNRSFWRLEVDVWWRCANQPRTNRIYYQKLSGVYYVLYNSSGTVRTRTVSGLFDTDPILSQVVGIWDGQPIIRERVPMYALARDMHSSLSSFIKVWCDTNPEDSSSGSSYFSYPRQIGDVDQPRLSEENFLLHEPAVIMDHYDDILFGKGFEHYWRNVATEQAYFDALQHVPRMSDNMISNILEVASFIKSLVVDKKVKIPKSLGDVWLAYRYTYGTAKMDAEQAIHFVHRHMDLGNWTYLHTYGQYTFEYEGIPVTCRCTCNVWPKELTYLQKIWKALYTYGLSPSFYTVWDMIPFSFIVDWLIPVGDVMAVWDAEREYTNAYDIKDIIFSISYIRNDTFIPCKCYTRWLSSTPVSLRGYYFFENDPSRQTIVKRFLDLASLTIG